MPEAIEWRRGRLREVRDLSPDIRLFEIEPAGEFVAAGTWQPFQYRGAD